MNFGPWEIWNEGECPVDPETKVNVQYAVQSKHEAECDYLYILKADNFEAWQNAGKHYDIIACREIIEPARETVTSILCYRPKSKQFYNSGGQYRANITCEIVDGKPDWSTLRAEEIE